MRCIKDGAISNLLTSRTSPSLGTKSQSKMAAKLLATLGILLIVTVLLSELTEARGRVRARTSSRRRSSISRSTSRTRRHFSPPGSSKVTKYTFIPVLASSSPVIRRQTTLSPSSHLYRNAFFGYLFYRYTLQKMPVYRGSYNMPNTVVQIPEERALRVSYIAESIRDINGTLCLGYSSKNYTISPGVNVSSVQTSLSVYSVPSWTRNNGKLTNFTLDRDLLNKDIKVRTVVVYDGSLIANTTCRQVESEMEGTMVRMYETNPDAAGTIQCSLIAVTLSSILYAFFLS